MKTMKEYIEQEDEMGKKIIDGYKENLFSFQEIMKKTKAKKWVILATGSSYNSVLSAQMYVEKIAGVRIELKEPYNYFEYEDVNKESELIIAVSQRGTSFSTIEALKKCKRDSTAPCLVLTSILDSPITSFADQVIDIGCGIETMPYCTKGVSATILTLFLMGIVASETLDYLDEKQAQVEIGKLQALIEKIPEVIEASTEFYKKNATDLNSSQRITPIGYGPNVGTVREAETKFTETVRVPTQGLELEAYMHGPIFELNEDYHVIITDVHPSSPLARSKQLNKYLQGYCKNVYTITTEPKSGYRKQLGLDVEVDERLSPLLLVIPYQILAHYISLGKGIDLSVPVFVDFDSAMKSKVKEEEG